MDEQSTHSEDELNLATSGDDVADTAATDTDEQGTDSTDEQKQDALNLEDETPKDEGKAKAETARDAQAEGWTKKILSGEKTLEDLPANMKWLKPFVEAKLGDKVPDIDKLLDEKIAERETGKKFQSIKSDLEDMGLSREKRVALEEKFKSFRQRGLSKLDALETAMETLNISPQGQMLEAKRQAMRLRTPGNYKQSTNVDVDSLHKEAGYGEVAKSLPQEKRLAYLRKLKGI